MIRRLRATTPALLLSLLLVVVAIGVVGAVHPLLIKYPRPGRSPIWLHWNCGVFVVGSVEYVDPSVGLVSFRHSIVRIDVWLLAPVLAFLVIWSYSVRWRRRKSAEGSKPICRVCGYDLRASKYRCPECGTPFNRRRVVDAKK